MKKTVYTLIGLGLLGCSEDLSIDTAVQECNEPQTPAVEEPSEEVVEELFLEEGTWAYSEIRLTEDRCGFSDSFQEDLIESIEAVRYSINHVAEGNYIIALMPMEGLEIPTSCVSNELELNCEPISLTLPAYGALLEETYTSFGTIDTNTRIEGQLLKEYVCEDDECSAAEEAMNVTFPCSVDLDYTLNYFD